MKTYSLIFTILLGILLTSCTGQKDSTIPTLDSNENSTNTAIPIPTPVEPSNSPPLSLTATPPSVSSATGAEGENSDKTISKEKKTLNYQLIKTIGVDDSTKELEYPTGLALDNNGNLYVTDFKRQKVLEYDAKGNFIREWGNPGNGPGQFINPTDLAIDPINKLVYISDLRVNRIQIFDLDGTYIGQAGGPVTLLPGILGVGYNPKSGGIVFTLLNSKLAASWLSGDQQLWLFPKSDSSAEELAGPYGITSDNDGNTYIVDNLSNRIFKLDVNGEFLLAWGEKGNAPGQFDSPYDIAVDSEGNVYVSDQKNFRIQKFNPEGQYIGEWSTLDDTDASQQPQPHGLVVDGKGRVYVAINNQTSLQGDASLKPVSYIQIYEKRSP